MPWQKGERYYWSVARDRGCDQPTDDTIATAVQTLELDWPPAMVQLKAAQERMRQVAAPGQFIEATYAGRFDVVHITGRDTGTLRGWSVAIARAQQP